MISENLKNLTDDEVINIINKIVTDNEDTELADLKLILAEASGRKLEKKYINIIAERIKAKIQPEPVEVKRKTEPKAKPVVQEPEKPTFDDVYSNVDEDEEEEDYDKYPVLSFLAGLYKVFAWILLVGIIVLAGMTSLFVFKNNLMLVCGVMFGSIVLAVIMLVVFYSMSEKIKISIDIEKHLRDLLNK